MLDYIGFYAQQGNPQNRKIVLAATNKMDYICEALIKIGFEVCIISASGTRDKKRFYRGEVIKLEDKKYLKVFTTVPWGNKIQKLISLMLSNFGVLIELFKIKKGEKVLVYHSLGYMKLVNFMHRVRKFHLVLEVEEIYADLIGSKKLHDKEVKFLQSADSYIFPTQLLDEKINKANKPSVLIHGTYGVEPDRKCNIFESGLNEEPSKKIHCVYAGTFDPRKGGAIAAAAAAEYLPSNYHIHILGFGNEEDTKNMKDLVAKLAEKCECGISFDGCLSGEDYIKFIQNCDIGLSTQNPDAAFNATSFPSKILSYMANGLRVVSIRIPAIEKSAIGEYMYYYDKQTPDEIANAIKSIDLNDNYNGRKIISELDLQFKKDLEALLEDKKCNE